MPWAVFVSKTLDVRYSEAGGEGLGPGGAGDGIEAGPDAIQVSELTTF
jgi:hypothetical protein